MQRAKAKDQARNLSVFSSAATAMLIAWGNSSAKAENLVRDGFLRPGRVRALARDLDAAGYTAVSENEVGKTRTQSLNYKKYSTRLANYDPSTHEGPGRPCRPSFFDEFLG